MTSRTDRPAAIADDITDALLPALVRVVARADYDHDAATLRRIQRRLTTLIHDVSDDAAQEGGEAVALMAAETID